MRLNVGCGRGIKDGWVNLDSQPLPGVDIVFDLEKCRHKAIPLDDDCADEFLVSHLLEHIVDVLPMMQELHRVAKNGAIMEIRVPHDGHNRAWADQTHVRGYNEESFGYFSQPHYHFADYGYRGDWKCEQIVLVGQRDNFTDDAPVYDAMRIYRNLVDEMVVTMRAVKPIRQAGKEYMDRPAIKVYLTGE